MKKKQDLPPIAWQHLLRMFEIILTVGSEQAIIIIKSIL
jgi:hypothetical protein